MLSTEYFKLLNEYNQKINNINNNYNRYLNLGLAHRDDVAIIGDLSIPTYTPMIFTSSATNFIINNINFNIEMHYTLMLPIVNVEISGSINGIVAKFYIDPIINNWNAISFPISKLSDANLSLSKLSSISPLYGISPIAISDLENYSQQNTNIIFPDLKKIFQDNFNYDFSNHYNDLIKLLQSSLLMRSLQNKNRIIWNDPILKRKMNMEIFE